MPRVNASMTIAGLGDLERRLSALSKPAAVRRITRPGITAGGRIIAKAAKRNAPRATGLLRRSFAAKTVTTRRSGVIAVISPREGFRMVIDGKVRNPTKYAHLVEFGTKPHVIKAKEGKPLGLPGHPAFEIRHPGTAPTFFLSRAVQSSKAQVYREMANKIGTALAREAKRKR